MWVKLQLHGLNPDVTRFSTSVRAVSVLGILTFFPLSVNAQQGTALEEVIVTAQRREQSLQETAISVTAFTSEAIEMRLLNNMADLSQFTPNVEINNGRADGGGSNAAIFIRGVGQFDFIFPTDPGVGVYLDNVYMGRTLGGMVDLTDLERVEVLRGPQGTLYGKNTIAGAINLVTAKPTGEFGGEAKITAGEYDRIDGSLNVNFPIIKDVLNGKASVILKNRDGYGESLADGRDFGDEDRQVFRGVLDWMPSQAVEAEFSADYTHWDQNGPMSNLSSVYPSSSGFRELFNAIAAPYLAARDGLPPGSVFDERYITTDEFTTYATGPVKDKGDVWGVSAVVDWEISGKVHLKSITSWREMDLDFGSDLDNTPFDFAQTNQQQEQDQLSQELQFSGLAFNERLDWLAGLYYFRERGEDHNFVHFGHGLLDALEAFPGPFIPLVPGLVCPAPLPAPCAGGAGNPVNLALDTDLIPFTRINTKSYSFFAHGIYHLTEKLNLNIGFRYTYEDKRWFIQESRPVSGVYVVAPTYLDETWDDFSPKIGLDYQINDELMVYVQRSEGFKSGGWNPRMFDDKYLLPYDPEYLTSYEIGWKSQWLDRRLTLNGAVFYYDYKDLQLSSFAPNPDPTIVVLTVQNAGQVNIHGFELEMAAQMTEGLFAQLGVGYQSNEYDELEPSVPWSIDNVLPDAPKWTINMGLEYRHPLSDKGNLTWRLDGSYKSETYKDPQNEPDILQDGLFLLNARIAFDTLDERWQLALFCTNLTDEKYITRGLHFTDFGFTNHYAGRPREWGVSLRYQF